MPAGSLLGLRALANNAYGMDTGTSWAAVQPQEPSADPLGAQAGMALQNCSELGHRGWAALQGPDLGHGGSLQLRAMAGREDLAGS